MIVDGIALEGHSHAAAYVAIMHTMSIYHIYLDRGDFEIFGAAFAEDGVFEVTSGTKFIGRKSVCEALARRREERLQGATASQAFQRHNLTTRLIDVKSPDTATAVSYFIVMSEIGTDHLGVYFDRFRRIGDKWLIAHRRAQLDWMHEKSRFRVNTGVARTDVQ